MPPIFFHSVVEPSENGPKEVGAFAKFLLYGEATTIWRADDETQNAFELRVRHIKAQNPARSRYSANSHQLEIGGYLGGQK